MLEVDGKFIPQTHAIQNFLAEEFGTLFGYYDPAMNYRVLHDYYFSKIITLSADLFGKGSLEKAQCFVIDETLRDVLGGKCPILSNFW